MTLQDSGKWYTLGCASLPMVHGPLPLYPLAPRISITENEAFGAREWSVRTNYFPSWERRYIAARNRNFTRL